MSRLCVCSDRGVNCLYPYIRLCERHDFSAIQQLLTFHVRSCNIHAENCIADNNGCRMTLLVHGKSLKCTFLSIFIPMQSYLGIIDEIFVKFRQRLTDFLLSRRSSGWRCRLLLLLQLRCSLPPNDVTTTSQHVRHPQRE